MRDRFESRFDVSLLLLRLVLGIVFVYHGGQKLFGWFGGPGMHGFASHMPAHLPLAVAYLVAIGEFFGGLGVLVGLLTRVAAIGPIASMAGAVALVHMKNGFSMQHQGIEFPLTLLVVAIAIALMGPGRYSLDATRQRARGFRLGRGVPLTA
jgi:putative oxidoreductase